MNGAARETSGSSRFPAWLRHTATPPPDQQVRHWAVDVVETRPSHVRSGLPAGSYTLEAWHEKLGALSAQVTVTENGSATAQFAFGQKTP